MEEKKSAPSRRYSGIALYACPKCRNDLYRIPRRGIDRLKSIVRPVHRYHCHFFSCHWEGNLPVGRDDFAATATTRRSLTHSPDFDNRRSAGLPKSFVVHMFVVAAGILMVGLAAYTNLLDPEAEMEQARNSDWAGTPSEVRNSPRLELRDPAAAQPERLATAVPLARQQRFREPP